MSRLSRAEVIRRTMTREGQPRHTGLWHDRYLACIRCGTTVRPHHSEGRCVDCFRALTGVTVRAIDGGLPTLNDAVLEVES